MVEERRAGVLGFPVADPEIKTSGGRGDGMPGTRNTTKAKAPDRPARLPGGLVWVALVVLALCAGMGGLLLASRPVDPDQTWRDAQAALREGHIDRAEELVHRLSRAREPLPQDWMLRGQVAIAREREDEGIADLKRIPEDHPLGARAWLLIGQIELRRDRARFAEEALLKALSLDPTVQQAHRELIYIYGMQLRRRELNREFTALSELSDLSYENLFHWCLMRNCLWEPGEVAQTLGGYLEVDPDDRHSRVALADNYRRLGLYDEAEEALAPLPDDDVEALAARVMIAMDRHQEDRAEELLESGPPDDPELARIRGRIALARRDGREAVRQYRLAYEADPSNRDTLFGLINALELSGDAQAAAPLRRDAKLLDEFNTVVQRMSMREGRADPHIVTDAAEACLALGLISEARGWYKLAIARNPLDSASQQALFRLNEKFPPNPPPVSPFQRDRG